jgi:hypothetical protein
MGYKLRREIRDLLPRGGKLTPSEWRLILELADWCNDTERTGRPGAERLAQFTDTPDADKVGEMFSRIAKKWVELRVPLGLGKDGRPFYSRPGKNTVYQFPPAEKLAALVKAPQDGAPKAPGSGGPEVPDFEGAEVPDSGGAEAVRPPKSGEQSPRPSSPRKDPSSLSPDDAGSPSPVGAEVREREASSRRSTPTTPAEFVTPYLTDKSKLAAVLAQLVAANNIKGDGWYFKATETHTLPTRVREAEEAVAATAKADKPDWCGDPTCNRVNRIRNFDGDNPRQCPECHPNRPQQGAGHHGDKPYRNPTDPNAYASYETGPRGNRLRGQTTRGDGPSVYDDPDMMTFR